MAYNKEMYTKLFNGITDATNKIGDANEHIKYALRQIEESKEALKNLQIDTEQIFIEKEQTL